MNIELAQVFTQIISFLIVLWVLKRFAWKPLLKILEDREKKIQLEFDSIENQKKENEALAKLYQQQLDHASKDVQELIKHGRESGLQTARKIEERAQEEAKKMVARTKEELKKEVQKAKNELRDEVVRMTLTATQKMVSAEMNEDRQHALVKEFLDELP